ncbi:MAG: phosphate signaling complex protein PhoU [Ruminococcaceae bacterium]|nr:phosphate signaling complex protein PhoU [Oscillospiraceae bacterium]
MRIKFNHQLEQLNNSLIKMGTYCETAIARAAKALIEDDLSLIEDSDELEKKIDDMEREIESLCFLIMLQQQPVAKDFRTVTSALKMITDMERIGDQAADIAEIINESSPFVGRSKDSIVQMAREIVKMVTDSIDSFVKSDFELATSVIEYDDVVDNLFKVVRNELIEDIRNGNTDAEEAIDLLMIAKYFERIGDHTTNIAEWVEYTITGSHPGGIM